MQKLFLDGYLVAFPSDRDYSDSNLSQVLHSLSSYKRRLNLELINECVLKCLFFAVSIYILEIINCLL